MRHVTRDESAEEIRKHLDNVVVFMAVLYKLDLSDEVRVQLEWRASVRHAIFKLTVAAASEGSPLKTRIERER